MGNYGRKFICARPKKSVTPETDEESEEGAFDVNGATKPTEAQTVEEIKGWLTAHSIDFTGKTKKADLLALIPNEEG